MSDSSSLPVDLDMAKTLCMGDEELYREMAEIFLVDAATHIEKLNHALTMGNAEAVAHHAHALKGMAANICAASLKESASRLEVAGRQNQNLSWTRLFDELMVCFRSLKDYLETLIASKDSPVFGTG